MAIQCVKDAVRTPYPVETIDTFTNRENTDATNVLQYDLDDAIVNEASKGDKPDFLS